MAKSKKVEIQNTELMPQVIGTIKKKKNNIGRVIIIFIAFLIAILYLPEITVFFNNTFGLHTAPTIKDNNDDDKTPSKDSEEKPVEEKAVYHEITPSLEISEDNFKLNTFQLVNGNLSFNIVNSTDASLDLSKTNYFMETYNENSTLLERYKVDLGVLGAKKTETITINMSKDGVKYIVFASKTVDDYPVMELPKDELGYANITCKKDYRTLTYNFKNDELVKVKDEIVYDFRVEDTTYTEKFTSYQSMCTSYDLVDGVSAAFNSSVNGFTAAIEIDMAVAKIDSLKEKHYYKYKEIPKVINFEMQTYGFTCS